MLRYYGFARPSGAARAAIIQAITLESSALGQTPAAYQASIWVKIRGRADSFADHLAQLPLEYKESNNA